MTKRNKTQYDPEFVAELKRIALLPPEATFTNVEDLLAYLNDKPLPKKHPK